MYNLPAKLPTVESHTPWIRDTWDIVHKKLDPKTQMALTIINKNSVIPTPYKKMVGQGLFNPDWEKETNPEVKQKITEYKDELEELISESILCNAYIKSLSKTSEIAKGSLSFLRMVLKMGRTSTLWDRIRTYICKPGTFLDKTIGKVLRLLKNVRKSLENEQELESKIAKEEGYQAVLHKRINEARDSQPLRSLSIKKLKDHFNKYVLEQKKVWDLFGGRDKFLQLPVIQLPEGQTTFYDDQIGDLNIKPEDMGDNAIMRGTHPDGSEFFVLRARTTRYKNGEQRYLKGIDMQIIEFSDNLWRPIGNSAYNRIVQASSGNFHEFAQQDRRDSLRDLIQNGEYLFDNYNFPDHSGRLGRGLRKRLLKKLPKPDDQ